MQKIKNHGVKRGAKSGKKTISSTPRLLERRDSRKHYKSFGSPNLYSRQETRCEIDYHRVSVQGVKSLGGHFAFLCRVFNFYEVKKNILLLFFKKKREILLHF